jgi:transcriptional regulator with XRE-family HTH domain
VILSNQNFSDCKVEVIDLRIWLKEARESRGETMKSLAEKLNISESYYCSIENGTRQKSMDVSLASKLSMALDIPIVDIFAYEVSPSNCDKAQV